MSESSRTRDMDCFRKCNQEYFECIKKGEHESVCKMKQVPCSCSCSIE